MGATCQERASDGVIDRLHCRGRIGRWAISEHNTALCAARERLPSPRTPGGHLTRAELADAVNAYLWNATSVRYELDDHLIGKWERGAVRWPIGPYRAALRAVLGVDTDDELGFRPPARVGPTSRRTPSLPGKWTRGTIVADATAATEHDVINRRDTLRGAAVEWHREAAPFATISTVRAARDDVAAMLPRGA